MQVAGLIGIADGGCEGRDAHCFHEADHLNSDSRYGLELVKEFVVRPLDRIFTVPLFTLSCDYCYRFIVTPWLGEDDGHGAEHSVHNEAGRLSRCQ